MEQLYTKYGKKNTFIFGVIITFILSLFIGLLTQYFSRTFRFEDKTFTLIKQTNTHATFKDSYNNLLEVDSEPYLFNTYNTLLHINYLDKTITYNSLDLDEGIIITLSDGSIHKRDVFGIYLTNSTQTTSSIPTEVILLDKIFHVLNNNLSTGILVCFNILSLILNLIGLMNIIYPEICWNIRYCMSVDGGEPSDFYIVSSRLGGYLLIGFSIFFPLFPLFTSNS
ncbi:hypothetical protein PBV87_01620 [Niameybacter massiliensis]|uniref:DUF6199 domain-containing protein n=1 Tax=Holtiella tumoricola TaxID=3018743 RepID=A0AA42DK65_9FIRM|nr:DUF6199 family natural product biosynthesis protein [Holtiella tumoricola]MDA3730213.1 hypothetical protein [Holtiella tumoricola]